MSKSFAMAGLRIGWLATRDRELLARCAAFKDYTTICSSAPSEILALIGLRARDRALARSRGIVAANIDLLDAFFDDWADRFSWVRPRGGSIGFPRLTVPGVRIDDWAAARRGRGRPAPAGLAVRLPRQPLPDRLRPDRPFGRARPGVVASGSVRCGSPSGWTLHALGQPARGGSGEVEGRWSTPVFAPTLSPAQRPR